MVMELEMAFMHIESLSFYHDPEGFSEILNEAYSQYIVKKDYIFKNK